MNDFLTYEFSKKYTDTNIADIITGLALKADAAEVYTKTETDSALALKADLSSIGVERIPINTKGYIQNYFTDGSKEINPIPSTHNNWHCAKVDCSKGDRFLIHSTGTNTNRAWAFVTISNYVITTSRGGDVDEYIVAPENTKYLVINANISKESYCLKGGSLVDRVLTIEDEIQNIPTKTSDLTNDSGFLTEHQNISGKADIESVNNALSQKTDIDDYNCLVGASAKERIVFIYGQYIQTNTDSIVVIQNSKYKSAEVLCECGDCFDISGRGGEGASISLWAFYDSENNCILRSGGSSEHLSNTVIKAPFRAAKLIVNIRLSGNGNNYVDADCYKLGKLPYLVSPYYENYIEEKINEINVLLDESGANGDSFVFITDYHRQSNALNSPALIERILNETGTRFVVFGGDAQDYEHSIADAMTVNKGFKKDFVQLWDKMYNVIGNHEFNSHYGASVMLSYTQIYSFFLKQREEAFGERNSYGDYWIDNKAQKIRYFFIGCTKDSTIVSDQLKWLFSELLSVPDGYLIVVFSHVTFKYVTKTVNGVEEKDDGKIYVQGNLSKIAQILTKYNRRDSSVSTQGEIYNFRQAKGMCVGIIGGHTHYDASTEYEKLVESNTSSDTGFVWSYIPVIATTTDAAAKQQDDTGELPRTAGTVTEQAFDVIHIDRTNRKIAMKRIGAGSDREFVFPWAAQNEYNTYSVGDVVSFQGRILRCISDIDENVPIEDDVAVPIVNGEVNTNYWIDITES